jgi:hypothetical protein
MVMRINFHGAKRSTGFAIITTEVSAAVGSSAFTQFIEIENRANINREHGQGRHLKLPRGSFSRTGPSTGV